MLLKKSISSVVGTVLLLGLSAPAFSSPLCPNGLAQCCNNFSTIACHNKTPGQICTSGPSNNQYNSTCKSAMSKDSWGNAVTACTCPPPAQQVQGTDAPINRSIDGTTLDGGLLAE